MTETGIEEIDRQVVLCRQDVPADAMEITAVPVHPATPEPAAVHDGDEDKRLLRWLAKRCPEIRGEPVTAGPGLPAGELPAPANKPACSADERAIPGKSPALAAGSGLSGEQPAGAAVPEFPEKKPAVPAGSSSGINPVNDVTGAIVPASSGKISGSP